MGYGIILDTNGFFPEEALYTKTLRAIDNQEAQAEFLIDGTDLSTTTHKPTKPLETDPIRDRIHVI